MDKITLEATEVTFDVNLEPSGSISFVGRSTPENSSEFYSPLIEWAENYVKSPADQTSIRLQIEYINSSSTKYLFEFLRRFESIRDSVDVQWFYEEDDMSIEELGQEFNGELDLDFKMNAISV